MRKLLVGTLFLGSLGLFCGSIGCAKNVQAPIPGSANQFDSTTYLTLVTTDAVIQSTRTALEANQFPANVAPTVKTALNDLIASYNVANLTYQAYHTAALAGAATPQQQAEVTSALATVQSKTAALTAAKGGQ